MNLMEQTPASPSVFLDLPQNTNFSNEVWHHVPNNSMMLPYISHILMEDDIDDELSDHPALLQVQQPFAQILSSCSLGTNTNNEGPSELLQEGYDDESALNSPLSKGSCVVGAYLKGMEEANRLLPKNSILRRDELVNQIKESDIIDSRVKKMYNKNHLPEEEEMEVKPTNNVVMMNNELEEKCGMLDKMMLHVYETCIKGMESVTIDHTDVERRKRNRGRIKAVRDNAVDIRRLLISCVQALAANNYMTACELLKQIKQYASSTGDTPQRLAHCFAKGLEARILGIGSQLWQLHMLEYPTTVEFLKAYSLYSEACCFINVTFIFSAMTITQAMAGKSKLHIVDYGPCFGFQWAGLLRMLARKEGGQLPEVKITAIARPKPICFQGEHIEQIGYRLMKCADELGLPSFKFHAIFKNWEDTSIMDLQTDTDEVLVVSDLFSFGILMEESMFCDAPSPRDIVLNNIKKMRPDIFIQNVMNRSYGSSFLSRFREMLFHYMALFDMLGTTMPRESESRLVLEKFLGCYVFNGISCEGTDLVERPEKYNQWQTRSQRAGLRQLQLKSSIMKVVKDEVTKHYHKDFMICQDGEWLLQGWMGHVLSAHTAWVADKDTSCG